MFEPMSARFASSFSRNGTSEAATDTSWLLRHVHERDTSRGSAMDEVAARRAGTRSSMNWPSLVERDRRLGDRVLLAVDLLVLVHGVHEDRRRSVTLPSMTLRYGRLDEAELVHAGVGRQRRDEADVRAFRRLDRADAAVVGRVHVADVEAGALAGQTARPEGREPPLVGDLGQRVRLVHELRELATSRRTPS